MRGQGREHGLEHRQFQIRPEGNSAVGERQLWIAEQDRGVRAELGAETFAFRAPAERAVETETMRGERFEAAAALIAGEMLAVGFDRPAMFGDAVDGICDS